jgi:PBSX family phage terminase large subunit
MSVYPLTSGTKKRKSKWLLPYKPLDWQRDPFLDKSPVLLLTGSAGGGKSKVVAEKLHAFCKKYPNATAMMLRKTRESMTNSTVLFVERSIIGKDPSVKHVAQKHRFEYANGSILAYGGMKDDDQREQVRGVGQEGGLDICWLEEATQFTEDDYNEISARMRGHASNWRQLILTTNPANPSHWIYKRLIQQGEAKTVYSKAADNDYNPPDYQATLNRLTGVLRDRLRDGRWVQAEGAVYPMWDASIHLLDPFEIPASWRRFCVVDFGYTNPFVCQWWAVDNDGRLYLYREIYMTQRTVADHAPLITRLSGDEHITDTVCDHDAEDRATLAQNGIPNSPALKDVTVGIQAVTDRLKVAGDGKPRLFMLRGALVETDPKLVTAHKPTCTLEEVDGYIWQPLKENKEAKEEPLKLNDHGMDALRYGVMHEDGGENWILA